MQSLKLFLLLLLIFTVHSLTKKSKKTNKSKVKTFEIDQQGLDLGEQILHEFDYQRTLFNIVQEIPRTQRMQEIAYEYAEVLLLDPSKLKSHPDFYARAKKFTDKCVYSEFAVTLISKEDFAHSAVKLWKTDEEYLNNMKKEYDEAGAYCTNYGNGYICTAVFLNLAEQQQEQLQQVE